MKRVIDICAALLLLALLSPVLLAAVLAIALQGRGPVIFRQVRIGRGCKTFHIYKFRSMVVDAEARGGYSTSKGDPRVTPVGRFLRRTSIDELPQLANVLKGDMSLVGPRPDVPAQEASYKPEEWRDRHRVRPGITGLAQARYRSDGTERQRTDADLEYVSKASLWLDLYIMIATFRRIVTKASN